MKSVILALVCIAVATSFPTDNPITEPPNIVVPETNDVDNMAALTDDREPEKRPEEQDEPPDHQRLSNRIYLRLGRRDNMEKDVKLDLAEEKGTPVFRLGRGGISDDNFVRLGRSGRNDNFVRLGRGNKQDNFIRFGRGRTDNFVRLGRGNSDNFIRFGRGRQGNFIRFGRGQKGNFFEFDRNTKISKGLEDTNVNFGDDLPTSSSLKVGDISDSNFIRFGGPNSFAELGHGYADVSDSGSQMHRDKFVRLSRSSTNNDLRRGKLSDRNFIRFGRSDQHYNGKNRGEESSGESEERLGRSNKPGNNQNFIRLGKRDKREVLRIERDVEHLQDMPTVHTGESTPNNIKNNTKYTRSKRSVAFSDEDETLGDTSVYPVIISNSAYDDDKTSTTVDDSQQPFRYYSPITSGIPNYIIVPELSVLPALGNGAQIRGGNGDGHSRNYVRLGWK